MSQCTNEPARLVQTTGRKDSQLLYLAARQAGVEVDLITEDDITELEGLARYSVVYAAGEWIESRATAKLDAWVLAGGTLYASAVLGARNEHDEANPAYLTSRSSASPKPAWSRTAGACAHCSNCRSPRPSTP